MYCFCNCSICDDGIFATGGRARVRDRLPARTLMICSSGVAARRTAYNFFFRHGETTLQVFQAWEGFLEVKFSGNFAQCAGGFPHQGFCSDAPCLGKLRGIRVFPLFCTAEGKHENFCDLKPAGTIGLCATVRRADGGFFHFFSRDQHGLRAVR